jgi:hypothetical protein
MTKLIVHVTNDENDIDVDEVQSAIENTGLSVSEVSIEGSDDDEESDDATPPDQVEDVDGATDKGSFNKDIDMA